MVLYGSRARGTPRADSDYDIALFLRSMGTVWHELGPIADIELDLLDRTGARVHAVPCPAGSWREKTGFMYALQRDGLDL